MKRSRRKPSRPPGNASVHPIPRTLAIRTSFCTSSHHDQCRHAITERHVTFVCACGCHADRQLALAL